MAGGPLLPNKKAEYRPYEFGNFPMKIDGKGELKPKSGVYKMMLPECADWTDKAEQEEMEAALAAKGK